MLECVVRSQLHVKCSRISEKLPRHPTSVYVRKSLSAICFYISGEISTDSVPLERPHGQIFKLKITKRHFGQFRTLHKQRKMISSLYYR